MAKKQTKTPVKQSKTALSKATPTKSGKPAPAKSAPANRVAAKLARIRPVMLAGGVTPDNVRELVRRVRPAGIDLAGGVESAPGVKDEDKLKRLFRNLKGMES